MAVLMAALIAPLFIDWTNYRADFEREATKILGRPVKVAGDASARILPFPSLSFSNVRVGEDIENPALTIERFSMDAELAPFLSGEVLIFDMRMTKPRGVVVVDADGKIDWTLRPNSPFDPGNVRIENLVVEGGNFDLIDEAAGRTHTISLPQGTISAKALTGPWRMNGLADVDGEPMHLSVSTGQAADGLLPFRISAIPTMRSVVIESDGSVKVTDGRVSYAGQFTLRPALKGDYEAAKIAAQNAPSGKDDAAQFKVSGKFGLAATGLALPEFKLETGARDKPYVASGSGSVIFGAAPMFDLQLSGTQVTFDKEDDAGAGAGLADRIGTFAKFVSTVPMPTMPGTLSVNLPAIVAGDTTIRDIAFTATPEDGAWRVRNFKSTLPGRTQMEADGVLTRGDAFGFAGKLLVASNQPAGLANWLTGKVDPAIRKLTSIGFSSNVDLKPDAQKFEALELALGGATFKGQAERRTDGERPALSLTLSGGALDLDSLNALAQGFVGENGESRFAGHDVSLTLDAGPVSQSGVEAAKLGVSLRMKENVVEIDRLMMTDIAGASISATGKVTDLGEAFSGNIDASLVSANGSDFVAMLAERFPGNATIQKMNARLQTVPDFLKDVNATMIGSTAKEGDARAGTISLNVKTSTGEFVFAGNGKGAEIASAAGSFQGSLREADPLSLVALAGVPLVPLGAPGPAVAEFSGSGDLSAGMKTALKIDAQGTSASFDGEIKFGETGVAPAGTISFKSDDFDPYLTAAGLVFSGVGTGTQMAFKSSLKTDEAGLHFGEIDGDINDTKLAGDLTFALAERPKISGAIKANSLDAIWFAENLLGTGMLDAVDGVAKATPFSTQPVAPFDGRVDFVADNLGIGPLGNAANSKGTIELGSNTVRFENISGTLFGGALSATFDLTNNGGAGAISGNFSLQGAKADAMAIVAPVKGVVDIGGSVTAAGKTLEGITAALTGSGVASINEGVVPGFNPAGFAPIIAATSTNEKAPSPEEVDALLTANVRTENFPLGSNKLAWSLAGGKLRMPGLKGEVAGAVLNADLSADLTEGSAGAVGSIVYDAGKESVVGAEPIVPFVASVSQGNSSVVTDAQPMLQYLTQSALEREQARVEALQSALVEKQRLRRDVRLISMLYVERDRRALLRESAVREEAARRAAVLAAEWATEKARLEAEKSKLEAERVRLEEEAKAKAAAEKAASEAGNAVDQNIEPPTDAPPPTDKSLNDVFKNLKLDLN